MEKLYIISNESIFQENGNFFCDNIDMKSTPEGLNNFFRINLFGRRSKTKRALKINLTSIKVSNNFFSYLYKIWDSLKEKNTKYLIISISPYTFLVAIFLSLFKKKIIVYLRSDGYKEYRVILGFFGSLVYHLMFIVISKISLLISCREHILRGKSGDIVSPSRLNSNWLINHKEAKLKEINLLYVGRIRKEKGVFSLIELINKTNLDLNLSIVGAENNYNFENKKKNIKFYKIEKDEKKLIDFYDNHNIFILPSYTEGQPMVIFEALSRYRPVIIFREIEHVIKNLKGIYATDRNQHSLEKTILHIKSNYEKIQEEIKKNILPTNNQFISELTKIIISK